MYICMYRYIYIYIFTQHNILLHAPSATVSTSSISITSSCLVLFVNAVSRPFQLPVVVSIHHMLYRRIRTQGFPSHRSTNDTDTHTRMSTIPTILHPALFLLDQSLHR